MSLTVGASAELQRVSDYQLSTGFSFDDQILTDPGVPPVVDENRFYNYNDFSFYFEDAWNATKRLTLTTGLRADVFHLDGDSTPSFFGTRDYDANGNCLPDAPFCKTLDE